ncbi:MAG: hypothetical protein OXH95_10525, partial [bacterium]|nr:hypothetical protein [bacterium]
MAGLSFEPRSFPRILITAPLMYRHRLGVLLPTAVVLDLPYAVLYFVLAPDPPAISPLPTNAEIGDFLRVMGPWLVIRLLITSILFAAVIRMVGEVFLGVKSSWSENTAASISRMASLTVLTVVFWVGVTMGSALFVLPGLFLVVSWSASLGVLIIEGAGPMAAFRRSWELTSGRRLIVFVTLVPLTFMVVVTNILILLVLGPLGNYLAGDLGVFLASELAWVVTQPLIGVLLGLLYIDLRVRRDQ